MSLVDVIEQVSSRFTDADKAPTDSTKMMSFPMTLRNEKDNTHSSYLIFHVVEPMVGGDLSGKTMKARQDNFLKNPAGEKSIAMIQMHMPAMMENLSHDYAKSDTTILDDVIDVGMTMMNKGAMAAKDKAVDRFGDRMIQHILSNPSITRETGEIHKQRHALLYGGTALRQQTFLYTMRARNLQELKEIGKIIYTFRKHSCGTSGGALSSYAQEKVAGVAKSEGKEVDSKSLDSYGSVSVPKLWYVEERVRSNLPRYTDIFVFGPAVVTNVRVNKTPDQVYATIAGTGGDPVEIELEVTMQEMIPVYSDFWDKIRGA